jgi:hypothetical protein
MGLERGWAEGGRMAYAFCCLLFRKYKCATQQKLNSIDAAGNIKKLPSPEETEALRRYYGPKVLEVGF